MPYVSRRLGDGLYGSIPGGDKGGAPSLLSKPHSVADALFAAGGCPWDRLAYGFPDSDLPKGARVIVDGRDAARQAVAEAARRLLLVDGAVWVRRREPCFGLEVSGNTGVTRLQETLRADRNPGYAFGLDRGDAFREFLMEAARAGLRHSDGRPPTFEVVRFEPGTARMAEDVANAAAALRLAGLAAGSEIDALSPKAIRLVADAAEVRGLIESGHAIPADADDILAKLHGLAEGVAPRLGTATAVGRVAVAMSLRSPEGGVSLAALEEDGEGLSALGR
jgi:hypothetical protein